MVFDAYVNWGGPKGFAEHHGAAVMKAGDIVGLRREVMNVAGAVDTILVENDNTPRQKCRRVCATSARAIAPR